MACKFFLQCSIPEVSLISGRFLWVVFQLDALCSQHCDDDIRQAIRDLPTDLTETFKRALRRIISRRNADMASKCFQWVAAANRPLSINELREAISIEIGQEYSKPERLPNNMRNISSFCENLVHVDEEKNIVQFAHHTVKQFLIDEISEPEFRLFHFKLEDVDHFIGEICVTYLNFNDFNTALVRRPKPPQHVVLSDIGRTVVRSEKKSHNLLQNVARLRLGAGKKPKAVDFVQALSSSKPQDATIATDGVGHFFLKYASENMMLHTKGFRKEKSLMWSQWKRMIIDGSDLFQYPWGTGPFREDDPAVVKWSFDYNHLGLIRIINAYRGMSHTKEQNDSLCRAIETYNMDLVETLLASGSDPNAISDEGLPVLGIAASIGALDAVDKLLLAGAHVNRSEPDIIPALHLAARSGKANIVKKLIAEGAVVNALFHKMSALHLAGERGYREIVELLLAAGADLRIAEYGLMGIVLLAARCGHTEILSDPVVAWDLYQKLDDNQICSAIYTAVTSGHPDVVHRIVQIRFKPIDSGSMTNSMLRLAVECGHLGVAQFALAQGADANTVLLGKDLYVPVLQKAAELDRQDMVDTLLTAGANMDFCDGPEMILHIAVKHGSLKILEKALAADADVNAVLDKDESYTALHIAAKLAALKVLNRLMKEKKRPRSERQNDTSYSDLAAERVFLDIINKLLDAGADVDRKTERGQTPLQVAARHWGSLLSGVSTGFNSSRMTTDETRLDLEAVLRGSRHGYRARQPDDEELEM